VSNRTAKLKLVGPKTGFLVHGEDRVGAVAKLMAKLADAGIDVTAIDAVESGGCPLVETGSRLF
jgi:hypothetical protein